MNAAERAQRLFPALSRVFVRFASKKQGGSTSNGRDSCPKFLGLKAGGGEVRALHTARARVRRGERAAARRDAACGLSTRVGASDAPRRAAAPPAAAAADVSTRCSATPA